MVDRLHVTKIVLGGREDKCMETKKILGWSLHPVRPSSSGCSQPRSLVKWLLPLSKSLTENKILALVTFVKSVLLLDHLEWTTEDLKVFNEIIQLAW